jgi:prolyl 4-hydroxylase
MTEGALSRSLEGSRERNMEYSQPMVSLDATKHGATTTERPGWVNASHGNVFQYGNQASAMQHQWASSHGSRPPLDPYNITHLQPFLSSAPTTHNLIPLHLQGHAMASTLNGTPGYQPALITPGQQQADQAAQQAMVQAQANALASATLSFSFPRPVLTVQDRPMVPPVYNGINPIYPGVRLINANPPIFAVDNFLTPFECQFLIHSATDCFGPAPVVGKGVGEISPSRTSSTCYLAREDLPDYLRKVSLLTGKPVEHCELPQVGRYYPSEQYLQHFDAFDLSNEDGRRFASNGGQRTVTVLVYLNDVAQGGATAFPALNLEVQPRQGMAIVFFPATVDGLLDKMALHAARPAIDTKYVSQVWIRQGEYNGQPSKRLPQTLGVPFGQAPPAMTATSM